MYDSHNIAIAIKELAKTKGVVIKTMLSELGLGSNTMSALYHGKSIASSSLAKIADYLDCSVDYLLGRAENISAPADKSTSAPKVVYMYGGNGPVIHKDNPKTEREQNISKLLEAVNSMSDKQIASLLSFIDTINS